MFLVLWRENLLRLKFNFNLLLEVDLREVEFGTDHEFLFKTSDAACLVVEVVGREESFNHSSPYICSVTIGLLDEAGRIIIRFDGCCRLKEDSMQWHVVVEKTLGTTVDWRN